MDVELVMDLEQRNREKHLSQWIHLQDEDVQALAHGIVTPQVQATALMASETIEQFVARLNQERDREHVRPRRSRTRRQQQDPRLTPAPAGTSDEP